MFVGCTPAILRPSGLLSALRPQDVFATSLYPGNDGDQVVTNGLDLATFGGSAWLKSRTTANDHRKFDSKRVSDRYLASNTTDGEMTYTGGGSAGSITYQSSGLTISGSGGGSMNASGRNYVLWSFRQADKFYKIGLFTHTAGVADTIDLASLGVVGWVQIKRRDTTGAWYVWTRGLTAGNNLVLNTTAAQSTTNAFISVSGTTLTFAAGAPAGNYEIEAWAHDPDPVNGIVQCGSVTRDANGEGTINLGWRPQWLLSRNPSVSDNWVIVDTARGWGAGNDPRLSPNTSNAEFAGADYGEPTATGFKAPPEAPNSPLIYMAIRAPIT